jgi:superfamily II DNA or RNA helicase
MEILAVQRGHTMLIQTDQTSHASILQDIAYAAGWPVDRVMMLTGRQSASERAYVRSQAASGDLMIISTIGKEALDIPRLDRYMLSWPTKSLAMTTQMIGRTKRVHEAKTEAPIVYDLYDWRVAPLASQFHNRRAVYEKQRLN